MTIGSSVALHGYDSVAKENIPVLMSTNHSSDEVDA